VQANFLAQALDALAISIFRLDVAQFGLIAHIYVPFAKSQADFGLVEGFDAQPLLDAGLAQHAPLGFGALK